jgi:hydrogenase maturation protein HypF
MALSLLHSVYGNELFQLPLPFLEEVPVGDRKLFLAMLERRINSPLTSSCGRLFDAVAAIIGLRNRVSYEGQAAIELEALAEKSDSTDSYPFEINGEDGPLVADFRPMFLSMVRDVTDSVPAAVIARCFHNTVAAVTAEVCERIRSESGLDRVVLSGGVFQNRLLSEGIYDLLDGRGFQVFTQRLVPPNDGGLALGQAIIAGRSLEQCV